MSAPGSDAPAHRPVRAIVVDDEPLLAAALVHALRAHWPELDVAEPLGDGDAAIDAMLNDAPDVAFLDIRMPGTNGLEVARIVRDEWHDRAGGTPPLIVFVTAHAEFAVEAFERAAVDYLIKPVVPERLADSLVRVRERLGARPGPDAGARPGLDGDALEAVADGFGLGGAPLTRLCAASGDRVHVIATEDVLLFEAGEKYVSVHLEGRELLIRRSLRELLPSLDPAVFARVHRRAIVNVTKVRSASRAGHGRLLLEIDGTDRAVPVSRAFAHLFRAM